MSEHATELLPWLSPTFEQLASLAGKGKLAHAYLLGGQEGLGKLELARHFGHYLLCNAPVANQACGQCRECQLLLAGTHPDLKMIQPEESAGIRIDQIRETINFAVQTSQRGGYKVVIINPAESMNINSANALLKVLEEPSANTLLLLVSHRPALLMATIRSRCHLIKFNRPHERDVIPWLESKNIRASARELLRMAGNVPLRALHYADEDALHDRNVLHRIMLLLLQGKLNIADAAAECEKFSLEENLESMLLCASDILAYNQGASTSVTLNDHDLQQLSVFFQMPTTIKALHSFSDEVLAARRASRSRANPNAQLLLESLFHHWAGTGRSSRRVEQA